MISTMSAFYFDDGRTVLEVCQKLDSFFDSKGMRSRGWTCYKSVDVLLKEVVRVAGICKKFTSDSGGTDFFCKIHIDEEFDSIVRNPSVVKFIKLDFNAFLDPRQLVYHLQANSPELEHWLNDGKCAYFLMKELFIELNPKWAAGIWEDRFFGYLEMDPDETPDTSDEFSFRFTQDGVGQFLNPLFETPGKLTC